MKKEITIPCQTLGESFSIRSIEQRPLAGIVRGRLG